MRRYSLVGALVALVAMTLAGCGGSDEVSIDDAWARPSASMQDAGAVYMTVSGGASDDELIGVSVDDSVAMAAELHETSMVEGDDGQSMMTMQQVPSIPVPADGTVSLEPGSYHVMLMKLTEPLVGGEEITVTLTFAEAGDMEVTAEVRLDE